MSDFIDQLIARREKNRRDANAILARAKAEGREYLTAAEERQFRKHTEAIQGLEERIKEERAEQKRSGRQLLSKAASGDTDTHTRAWAGQIANTVVREKRALSNGSLDVPALISPQITSIPFPQRILDLIVNRQAIQSNVYEYFRQVSRTNNAGPVADYGLKPTTDLGLNLEQGRARIYATLSEALPLRFLDDIAELQSWLVTQLAESVLQSVEKDILSGDGTGEHPVGLLETAGVGTQTWTGDPAVTIRSAITKLQIAGYKPNAIALHPSDAQSFDLLRWGSSGGFLTGGFANDTGQRYGTSDNIFGPASEIQRVISPSVPQGTAIIGDWSQIKLFVRQDMQVVINMWDASLFQNNLFQFRSELRCSPEILRPEAFVVAILSGLGS